MKRINKRAARKYYEEGKHIYVYPCKARIDSFWCSPCIYHKENEISFDQWNNEFIYYNCNNEMGKYPKYFLTD